MTDDILTKDAAAKLLDCAASTFEDMARAGTVPACKVGGSWITHRAALADWICEQAKANLKAKTPDKPTAVQKTITPLRKGPPKLPQLVGAAS